MPEKSKQKIDKVEAIESLIERELTPEEADKISGGKNVVHCPGGEPYPEDPWFSYSHKK